MDTRLGLLFLACLFFQGQTQTCLQSAQSNFWKMNGNVCEFCECTGSGTTALNMKCLPVTDPYWRYGGPYSYNPVGYCLGMCAQTPADYVQMNACSGNLGYLAQTCAFGCKCNADLGYLASGTQCTAGNMTCMSGTGAYAAVKYLAKPSGASTTTDCGPDIGGITCPATSTCYKDTGDTMMDQCVCSSTANPPRCMMTQDTMSSDNSTTVISKGCANDFQCRVFGINGACASAPISYNYYTYDCATNATKSTAVSFTYKSQCKTGANSNTGGTFMATCPVSSKLQKAYTDVNSCFNGDQALVQLLGTAMCGHVTLDFSCSSAFGSALYAKSAGCFCKFFKDLSQGLDAATTTEIKAFGKKVMDEFTLGMSHSLGCTFTAACDIGTGVYSGTVKTFDVSFTATLVGLTLADVATEAKKMQLEAAIGATLAYPTKQIGLTNFASLAGNTGLSVTVTVQLPTQAAADAFKAQITATPPVFAGVAYNQISNTPSTTVVAGTTDPTTIGAVTTKTTATDSNKNPVTINASDAYCVRFVSWLLVALLGVLSLE